MDIKKWIAVGEIVLICLAILNLIFGFQYGDSNCIEKNALQLNPGTWLWTLGFLHLSALFGLWVSAHMVGIVVLGFSVVLEALWFLFGIIIMAQSLRSCLRQSHILGIWVLVNEVAILVGISEMTYLVFRHYVTLPSAPTRQEESEESEESQV